MRSSAHRTNSFLQGALLAHKQARGLARCEEFTAAAGRDVDAVLAARTDELEQHWAPTP
ncbi:hypothetical protein [Streptomyces sp. NPDC007369]|uniref:hypothetical protein n=1 Tax=Streptomyces sp. NPDC007369 TaxID=3154589 RepID=UPI0034007CCC